MGIMDSIRKMSEKKSISKHKYKEAEENMKINRMLDERQKSSNQRELERYYKEQEEADIKKALETIRKKKQKEAWSGTDGILNNKMNILKEDRPILKEKNIFVDNRNDVPLTQKGDMFFKW